MGPYKQNQNCVEHWIQEAKPTVSQIKLHTGCDDQYICHMWAHVSNINNNCAKKVSNGVPLLKFFLVRPQTCQFLGMFFMPQHGIGNGTQRMGKSECLRGSIWVLHGT